MPQVAATTFNPHMMPLMKFTGENWEDFSEHFEFCGCLWHDLDIQAAVLADVAGGEAKVVRKEGGRNAVHL